MEKRQPEGEREILLDFLKDKFKNVPPQYQQNIELAERKSVLNFLRRAITSKKIEEIFEDNS